MYPGDMDYFLSRPLIRNESAFFVHIAQLEEQPALNRQVPGSRPGVRSMHRAGRRGANRSSTLPGIKQTNESGRKRKFDCISLNYTRLTNSPAAFPAMVPTSL